METAIKSRTPFQQYLYGLGDEKAAQLLGVPERTVKSWRLGDRVPRPTQARQIIATAPVSMDDIYGGELQGSPAAEAMAKESVA